MKVKSIRKIGRARVINLTVHKNHTFITENGIVVHNCDNFSQAGQSGFRSFIDEFSQNCKFIFTGNYKDKVIEPLLSRLINYDFNNFPGNEIIEQILNRMKFILDNEHIEYDIKDVKAIIKTYYPKIRDMVGCLQKFSIDGKLTIKNDELNDQSNYEQIINDVNNKNYTDMIYRVNSLTSPDGMYSYLYKHAPKFFDTAKYPHIVITIAKYQAMSSQVRDKNLNLAACLTELMLA